MIKYRLTWKEKVDGQWQKKGKEIIVKDKDPETLLLKLPRGVSIDQIHLELIKEK